MFTGAAICNAGLAFASGLFPDRFFALLATTPPDDPCPWSWVAIMIGALAPVYAYAAWRPERGDLAIAIGLTTKIVGPAAWVGMVAVDRATPSLFPLVLCGDILWWFPLAWYLLRKSDWQRPLIAWFSVATHLAASLGLVLVAEGTELNPDVPRRHQWIVESTGLWVATWACWSISSISLLATCWAWRKALASAARRLAADVGCAIIAIGVGFDLCGETILVVELTRHDLTPAGFASAARMYQLLSPVVANGLYPAGGLLLSIVAWQEGHLRGVVGVAGFAMWIVAIVLTLATLANHTLLMTASGAAIMLLYLPWATMLGWRLRSRQFVLNS